MVDPCILATRYSLVARGGNDVLGSLGTTALLPLPAFVRFDMVTVVLQGLVRYGWVVRAEAPERSDQFRKEVCDAARVVGRRVFVVGERQVARRGW